MATNLKCTAPNCSKPLDPKAAWLPEIRAMARAAGRRVSLEDFHLFALCGHHGHLLRQTGVRVYRWEQTCERERKLQEQRQAEAKSWAPFAALFTPKPGENTGGARPKGPRRGPDGRGVGQGLSRLSKIDAEKRRLREAEKSKADGQKPPEPSSPTGDSQAGDAGK
jgi:hypothetical protein